MALKLDDMAKMSGKQKLLLVVIISALIVGGYYYGFLKEAHQRIGDLQKQLTAKQNTINKQKEVAKNLETFQEEVVKLEAQLTLLLEQLPNSAEIPSLLKNISDLGKESGLVFMKFTPSKEVNKGFYAEIPVAITVSGDYHSFVQFADKVSQYPRIVNLLNILFTSPKAVGTRLVRSTVSCTATTYRFLDEPVAKAPSSTDTKKKKAGGKGGRK